jgi:hypothetical protein
MDELIAAQEMILEAIFSHAKGLFFGNKLSLLLLTLQ